MIYHNKVTSVVFLQWLSFLQWISFIKRSRWANPYQIDLLSTSLDRKDESRQLGQFLDGQIVLEHSYFMIQSYLLPIRKWSLLFREWCIKFILYSILQLYRQNVFAIRQLLKTVFYRSLIDLQCCVSFRCAAKWFRHVQYIFFFRWFSTIRYYKILSRVPSALQ